VASTLLRHVDVLGHAIAGNPRRLDEVFEYDVARMVLEARFEFWVNTGVLEPGTIGPEAGAAFVRNEIPSPQLRIR
jgi:hypothetical protein